jgi:hypothetical protein
MMQRDIRSTVLYEESKKLARNTAGPTAGHISPASKVMSLNSIGLD